MKNTKSENADDTKQIADGTKQNKKRTRGICGSPWVPILRLDRIVRWSVAFIGQIEVSVDTLEKTTRFAEVERKRFLHYKDTMNKICYHVYRRNKRPILHYFITMMIM
ncbi:hypothetical protein T4D_8197 [Trichinella pseudospiralis]|uniref:Uncharacterized protein n=1 Tax=Trichinella pseudospiralis TaxID=6337 RepID=A0A0V1FEY8_TRIPS|nr:hypothetical protein T4D_8197 [Trichinella pseudospiralis]